MNYRTHFYAFLTLLALLFLVGNAAENYKLEGTYIESCNCEHVVPCELGSGDQQCETLGAMILTGGEFMNVELNEAKLAYAVKPGEWVRVYIDARNPVQREALIAFATGYLSAYGKIEATKEARIEITGERGQYSVKVDDGRIMQLTTQPVIGGDNENPITFHNTKDKLNPEYMAAKTVFASFKDGERNLEFKDTNAFFNNDLDSKGSL